MHGDERLYPIADVTAVINKQSYLLTVKVGEGLPVDAVLGWNFPIPLDLFLKLGKVKMFASVLFY